MRKPEWHLSPVTSFLSSDLDLSSTFRSTTLHSIALPDLKTTIMLLPFSQVSLMNPQPFLEFHTICVLWDQDVHRYNRSGLASTELRLTSFQLDNELLLS